MCKRIVNGSFHGDQFVSCIRLVISFMIKVLPRRPRISSRFQQHQVISIAIKSFPWRSSRILWDKVVSMEISMTYTVTVCSTTWLCACTRGWVGHAPSYTSHTPPVWCCRSSQLFGTSLSTHGIWKKTRYDK